MTAARATLVSKRQPTKLYQPPRCQANVRWHASHYQTAHFVARTHKGERRGPAFACLTAHPWRAPPKSLNNSIISHARARLVAADGRHIPHLIYTTRYP